MPTHVSRYGSLVLCTLLLFGTIQFGTTAAAPDGFDAAEPVSRQASQSGADSDDAIKRLREGTIITDVVGYFRQDGDGATFVTDDGQEFGGLSNLNLERVVRTLKGTDESKRLRWSVSGVVTEFMSRNFLLISRAVYKSATLPPVPGQLSN